MSKDDRIQKRKTNQVKCLCHNKVKVRKKLRKMGALISNYLSFGEKEQHMLSIKVFQEQLLVAINSILWYRQLNEAQA